MRSCIFFASLALFAATNALSLPAYAIVAESVNRFVAVQ
jgi:hypothetical protein